ncbi:MAG: DNA-binding Lrp family transcriptional regulator [Paracoccaceae bacterium]|jgi:DNA-binding Lrp family transcriptional regulator
MLDDTDRRLLIALQRDAHLTALELGEALNLSPSQAGRRRQRLEAEKILVGSHAQIDPNAVGLGVQAFVQVQMATHSSDAAVSFARLVSATPAITAAFTLTGEADYLLRVWCRDLAGLHQLIHGLLLPHPVVARVQSQIVMDQMKADSPLPL